MFFLYCGLVWISSVGKIKTANQTKPNQIMRLSKKKIRIHMNQMQFFAVLI